MRTFLDSGFSHDRIHHHGEVDGTIWFTHPSGFGEGKNYVEPPLNGYIRLPDDHPWLAGETWEHTFYIPAGNKITYREGNWVGFDTHHLGQYWPIVDERPVFDDFDFNFMGTPYEMTQTDVVEWTKSFARQANSAYMDRHDDEE